MREDELEKLADLIAARMPKQHPPACIMFTQEEVIGLKGFLKFCERSRVTALATFVGFVVLGLLGLLGAGVISWFQRQGVKVP